MTRHASQAQHVASEPHSGPDMPFSSLAPTISPAVEAAARIGEACTRAKAACQEELLRFVGDRLTKDAELGRSLISCQNWSDVLRLQQEWAVAAARDYAEEATRLARLATRLSQDGVSAWAAKSDPKTR